MKLRTLTYCLALPYIALLNGTITSIPGLGSIARIAAMPLVIVWIIGLRYGCRVRQLHWFHWTVFAFVFWNLLSFFWARSDFDCIENISRYIPVVITVIVLWDVCRERSHVIGALQAYVLGAYIICLSTAYGYFTNTSDSGIDGRFSGIGFHPDDFVYLLAVPIAWELSIRSDGNSKILKTLNAIYPIVAACTIIMTETRGSLFVALPIYGCILLGIRRAPKFVQMGAAATCVLACSALAVGSIDLGRLTAMRGSSDAATMNGRLYLWNAAFDLMGKYPFQGIGSGSFHTISSFYPGVDYTEEGLPAHNTYLSVFAELGAIGFAIYLVNVGAALWIATQVERGYRAAYVCSILGYLIGSSALTYETKSQEWLLFILIVCHRRAPATSTIRLPSQRPERASGGASHGLPTAARGRALPERTSYDA